MSQTFADAKRIQTAVERLRPLVESGEATPAEQRALQTLEAQMPAAEAEIGATGATYRGFGRGVTAGLSDDIAGLTSAIRGDGFGAGREGALARDQQARQAFPQEFERGEMAGGAALAGGTLLMGGPVLKGASMGVKAGAGGVVGGGLGALHGQSDYEMAGSPPGERFGYMAAPVAVGAGTGAAAYPAGHLVGAGVRRLQEMRAPAPTGYSRKPSETLTRAWSNTESSGLDIQRYLDDLTEEAMLADVPGDMQGTAQGLAALRGAGGSALARAINERAQGAGRRISDEIDRNISAPNAAFTERTRLAQERTNRWGPEYEAALSAPGAVEIRPLIAQLDEAMRMAGPDTAPVLQRFANDLRGKAPNGLIDPTQLHWTRSDLSDALQGLTGPSKRNALLQSALKQIDEILDTNVPGYADARTGYANTYAMERAIEEGEKALRGGRATAASPEEFAARFSQLSDAQKDAFRTGLRRDIAALMGTAKNDAAAAWGEFAKEWNEDKLRIALGPDAEPIIKRLRAERAFSETRGKVTAGSKTSETQEARDALGDYRDPETGKRPGPIARFREGMGDIGNTALDAMLYGSRTSRRNAELGDMLSRQGAERDAIVRALMATKEQRQLPSPLASRFDKIVRALMASGGGAAITNYSAD